MSIFGASAPPTEWTMELGHMAIFGGSGGTGELRDPDTEAEIYAHILKQQMAYVAPASSDVDDDDDAGVVPEVMPEVMPEVAPEGAPEECIGTIDVMNYYNGSSVGVMDIWLRDEGHRHEHYDEDPSKRGKFLAFEGARFAKQTTFKVHVELDDNVDETLRALGACMYMGEAPGSALETVVQYLSPDYPVLAVNVMDAGNKTWRQVLAMKPVRWSAYPTNINIQMSLHNPHAVVVSAYEAGVALATNRTILKKIQKQ